MPRYLLEPMIRSKGQALYSEDGKGFGFDDTTKAELVQVLQDCYDLTQEGVFVNPGDQLLWKDNSERALCTGEAAMGMNWSSQFSNFAGYFDQNLAMTTQPLFDNGTEKGMYVRPAQFFSITKDCPDPETAAKAISFFINDKTANETLNGERGIPASKIIREELKTKAEGNEKKVYDFMDEAKRSINNLRIKVVWFRDFYYDGNYAYDESKFFELPEEKEEFRDFVNGIHEAGGGDDPESGLEALTMAMRSDFVQEGAKKRHIIVLFTDAAAHPFEDYDELTAEAAKKGCKPTMYPKNMPKNISEFYNAWEGNAMNQDALGCDGENTKLDATGRRLVLFAPNDYPWCDMEVDLSRVIRKDIEAGQGGSELEMDEVYSLIAYSMS